MSEKRDNPQDHGHSDYSTGMGMMFFAGAVFLVVLSIAVGNSCYQTNQLEKRVAIIECNRDVTCLEKAATR